MKLAILLLSLTGSAIASLNEVLVRHPGGIGGIFKGPNLETIVKGPDGSVITSQQEGAEVRTDLEAVAGGTVVPNAVPAVENVAVAGGAGVPNTVPTPVEVGLPLLSTGVDAGDVTATAPVREETISTVTNAEVAPVSILPVKRLARPLSRRLRPLGVGQLSTPETVAVPTGNWDQGYRSVLQSSTLSPVELDLPPITRNSQLEAVRVDSTAATRDSLSDGNVELAVVSSDLSSNRGNLRLSNDPLNGGNVPVFEPDVLSASTVVSSPYSPSELDLSSGRGNLGATNAAQVAVTTYSPLESDLSSGRGNLRLLNNAPNGLNIGNIRSSEPNVISVVSSTYSPSELDLSPIRGNLASNTASGAVPLPGSNIASPIRLSTTYSPLESDLSTGRGNLRLLNNVPVSLKSGNIRSSEPNVISVVSSTYSPSELDLSSGRENLGASNAAQVAGSNIASPIRLSTTYSPLESDLSTGRGNLRLLNNAPNGLNTGNIRSSEQNIAGSNISPSGLPISTYPSLELGDGSINGLLPRTGEVVRISSSNTLSPTSRVRNENLPVSIGISPPTRLPPSTNLQRSKGNLVSSNNQIQGVAQSPPGLGNISPVAFPINDDQISPAQIPAVGSTLPPNLSGNQRDQGLLLNPSRDIIPPEIGIGPEGDEGSRGRLYYGDRSGGLLRDTNPVGASTGGYSNVYEDTSIVLANRYGKRRA